MLASVGTRSTHTFNRESHSTNSELGCCGQRLLVQPAKQRMWYAVNAALQHTFSRGMLSTGAITPIDQASACNGPAKGADALQDSGWAGMSAHGTRTTTPRATLNSSNPIIWTSLRALELLIRCSGTSMSQKETTPSLPIRRRRTSACHAQSFLHRQSMWQHDPTSEVCRSCQT